MKLSLGQFLTVMLRIESKSYAGFMIEDEWSFYGDKIKVRDKTYTLGQVLKLDKEPNFTVVDLKGMTAKVIKIIEKYNTDSSRGQVNSLSFNYSVVKVIYSYGAKVDIDYKELVSLWVLTYGEGKDNPFSRVKDRAITRSIYGDNRSPRVDRVLSALESNNYICLSNRIIRYLGEVEHILLYGHPSGTVVFFTYLQGKDSISKGSVFVHSTGYESLFQSMLRYDGGGNEFRRDLYSDFILDLFIGWEVKVSDWIYGISDGGLSSFMIYANSDLLEYLGGRIREMQGGENKYVMLNDVFSSHELSMLCSIYEVGYIVGSIQDTEFQINKNKIKSELNDYKKRLKKAWGKEGVKVWNQCKSIIDKVYQQQ